MPYLLLTIVISIIVAIFAVQNAMSVSLNFFVWNFDTSLVIVILGSFLLGVLVGAIYLLVVKARHYLQVKKLHEEIAALQIQNKALDERVSMLMHTQMLRDEAPAAEEPQGEPVGK